MNISSSRFRPLLLLSEMDYRAKLPFRWALVPWNDSFLTDKTAVHALILNEFGVALEVDSAVIKLTSAPTKIYFAHSTPSLGVTIIHTRLPIQLDLFHVTIDGHHQGIAESIALTQSSAVVICNHPCVRFCLYPESIADIISVVPKSSVSLAPCSELGEIVPFLRPFIRPEHISADCIAQYAAQFVDSSMLVLHDFFLDEALQPLHAILSYETLVRIGPADYRSFRVARHSTTLCDLLCTPALISWLAVVTGLPLLHPAVPVYLRVLESGGDYQILHGNYSEPFGLDIIFSYHIGEPAGAEWPQDACGRVHYLDESGSEILQVSHASNSLTLVYRTEGVVRFTENVKGTHRPLVQLLGTYTVDDTQ